MFDVVGDVGDVLEPHGDAHEAGRDADRQPFLLGEAPRLLFPFARRIVSDAIRDGGFPPLMLEPIDFNGLYVQQAAARAQGGEPTSIEGVGNA